MQDHSRVRLGRFVSNSLTDFPQFIFRQADVANDGKLKIRGRDEGVWLYGPVRSPEPSFKLDEAGQQLVGGNWLEGCFAHAA
jgi:hypothetical protein